MQSGGMLAERGCVLHLAQLAGQPAAKVPDPARDLVNHPKAGRGTDPAGIQGNPRRAGLSALTMFEASAMPPEVAQNAATLDQ